MFIFLFANLFSTSSEVRADFNSGADTAILVDASTGNILYEKNADFTAGVASMSKMMTEYLVLEAVNNGSINWDSVVPISDLVNQVSHSPGLSNVFLDPDEDYTVRDLYEAMAIESGNAATMALAEYVGGTYTDFVRMMNDKAEELDLQDYKFVNSTGLNNSYLFGQHAEGTAENDENQMSARATAKLAYHLINDYPEVLETASIPMKYFQGEPATGVTPQECLNDWTCMKNWNDMLPGLGHFYEGIDGLKTGYTDFAKYCFTGTAERNDLRLISVVMGTESETERFNETRRLMDYGFNTFSSQEVIAANAVIEDHQTVPVAKGKEKEVAISTNEALTAVVKEGEEDYYRAELQLHPELLNEDGELIAPLERGEEVGTVNIVYEGEGDYDSLIASETVHPQVAVVTDTEVEKAGWFRMMMRGIGGFFSGIWSSAADTVKGWF
ncbi:D-alanyl-D-alanine carboxypeptidase [Desertibacillus haloalkaliphilus]|nr:D-alanyl-D-alanine carboxypeptidase [Desertibacillus haloalkaliphilus]